jgi:hypothetical protein
LLSTPPSSPGSVEHNAGSRAVNISTLELQSLLPRTRRTRNPPKTVKIGAQSVYDLNSESTELRSDPPAESDSGSDTSVPDEVTPVRRGKRRGAAKSKAKAPRAPLSNKRNAAQSRAAASTKAAVEKGKTPLRKYGRQQDADDADKENLSTDDETYHVGPDPDGPIDESSILEDEARVRVMQKMRDKFNEIDEWEMEFESVDFSQTSSPWR